MKKHVNLNVRGVIYADVSAVVEGEGVAPETVYNAIRRKTLHRLGTGAVGRAPAKVTIRGTEYADCRAAAAAIRVPLGTVRAAKSSGQDALDRVGLKPLRNITAEDLAPIWSRHEIPKTRIAEALGVSRQGLSWKARSLGLPDRPKVRRCKLDDETFTELWLAGVRAQDIADAYGYSSRSAIGVRAGKLNLPRRKRGGGGRGGWPPTISLLTYREREIGEAMRDFEERIAA